MKMKKDVTNKLQPFFVVRRAQAVAVHIDHRYSDRLGRLEMKCNISENTQVDV